MNAFSRGAGGAGSRRWSRGIALVAMAWGVSALAQVVSVPAAHLNHAEGTVALSPLGDNEWHDVQPRRVLKRGDRLWVDRGSRAEVQAGGHALRLDGQTQLILENVSDTATQLSLTQGSLVITVTRVNPGDSVEIGTPNLAFRARQPGDYRIDVDAKAGTTRVVVLGGDGVVYGEKGEALELRTGQRAAFKERALAKVPQGAFAASDDFDRWALARRRGEPTVSMPQVAQAPSAPPPRTELVNKGKDIVIAGPASSLPGAKLAQPTAAAGPLAQAKVPPAQVAAQVAAQAKAQQPAPAAPALPVQAVPMVPHAQVIPTVPVAPATPAAVPLRVTAPATAAQAQAQVQARAAAQAQAAVQAAQAAEAAREQQRQQRVAQQREDERRAAIRRAEEERKAVAARRAEEQRRAAVAAKRAEQERHHAQAKKAEEAHRVARSKQEEKKLAARRAAEEKRLAAVRREEEKRQAAARAAEAQKLAEARKRHLARLQEQAGREEQSAREQQARREQDARLKAEEQRREEVARREEQARREEADRRQRQLADQWRREQEKRDQEVWLRQQQGVPAQPVRPAPMGVPFRRVS